MFGKLLLNKNLNICFYLLLYFVGNCSTIIYGNNSKVLFTGTETLMYVIKTKDAYDCFSNDKEMFDFNVYSTKYYNDS